MFFFLPHPRLQDQEAAGVYTMSNFEDNHALIQVSDLANLQHMVGAHGRQPGFRNHFVAGEDNMESLLRLVVAGLCVQRTPTLFTATEQGCRAAGLGKTAIRRALES